MPKWVKHMLWALLAIFLIARWRDVGGWLGNIGRSIGALVSGEALSFDDPIYRFTVFGVLVVAAVALFALWVNRSRPGQ